MKRIAAAVESVCDWASTPDYTGKNADKIFIFKIIFLVLFFELLSETGFWGVLYVCAVMAASSCLVALPLAESLYTGDALVVVIRRRITLIPKIYYDENDEPQRQVLATLLLILANVIVFSFQPVIGDRFIRAHLIFPPQAVNLWNAVPSLVTSCFLHGNIHHLLSNMYFLFVFGSVLERKIGPEKFLKIYFGAGVLSGLIPMCVSYVVWGRAPGGLGASGAIMGIAAAFAIRCCFSKFVFPVPVFMLPVYVKVRFHAVILFVLICMSDVRGYVARAFGDNSSNIGYGAHLAGALVGLFMAYRYGLRKLAVAERHVKNGMAAVDNKNGLASGVASLEWVLEENPSHGDAKLALARLRSRRTGTAFDLTDQGAELYRSSIVQLIETDPGEAADVYVEYFNKYRGPLDPSVLFRVTRVLYRRGQHERAASGLELLVADEQAPEALREKALFRVAEIMTEMNCVEAAQMYYRQFLERYPASPLAAKVHRRLSRGAGQGGLGTEAVA